MLSKVLSQNGFIMVNKDLAKKLGLNCAVIIGYLYSMYDYWKGLDKLEDDESFYCTRENIEEHTTLSPYEQRKALNILEKEGIIYKYLKGLPAKTFYKLNDDKIIELLETDNESPLQQDVKNFNNKELKNLTSNTKENLHQEAKEFNINNNILNKKQNKNKDNNIISKNSKSSKISKNEKKLKNILKIIDEYDFNEKVIDLLETFFKGLIDNNVFITDEKIRGNLNKIANKDLKTQLNTIQLSLDNGYKNLDPSWLKNSNYKESDNSLKWEHDNFSRAETQAKYDRLKAEGKLEVF